MTAWALVIILLVGSENSTPVMQVVDMPGRDQRELLHPETSICLREADKINQEWFKRKEKIGMLAFCIKRY